MYDTAMIPSEQDLLSLKSEIAAAKRKVEYEKLKKDLHDITYKAVNTPNEFDGVMQMPDTKTRRNGFISLNFFLIVFAVCFH